MNKIRFKLHDTRKQTPNWNGCSWYVRATVLDTFRGYLYPDGTLHSLLSGGWYKTRSDACKAVKTWKALQPYELSENQKKLIDAVNVYRDAFLEAYKAKNNSSLSFSARLETIVEKNRLCFVLHDMIKELVK